MFLRPHNQPAGIRPDYLLTLFKVPTWPPAASGKDENEEGTQLPGTEATEDRERALRAASWAHDTIVGIWNKPEGNDEQLQI